MRMIGVRVRWRLVSVAAEEVQSPAAAAADSAVVVAAAGSAAAVEAMPASGRV